MLQLLRHCQAIAWGSWTLGTCLNSQGSSFIPQGQRYARRWSKERGGNENSVGRRGGGQGPSAEKQNRPQSLPTGGLRSFAAIPDTRTPARLINGDQL